MMHGRNYGRNQAYNSSARRQEVRIQEVNSQERRNPNIPSEQSAQIRFFNAAAGFPPLNISVEDTVISSSLGFGRVTDYSTVKIGFNSVTVTIAETPNVTLLTKSIPIRSGDVVTIAIINTAKGIDLKVMNDKGCENVPNTMSCFRVANFSYTSGPIDVILEDGKIVFSDVRFKEVTEFKQAVPGEYNFTVVLTREVTTPENKDLNVITEPAPVEEGGYLEGEQEKPVMYFYEDLEAGKSSTSILIGNVNFEPPLQVVTI